MTNLQIENCLKGYPATVCCADVLSAHVGVRPRTFIVNTDTCDRGGSHLVAFHFPLVETKHMIVFKTDYFEVVVSHGYFDVLTYATSHSVIDRVLESDVGNIFVQDT
jgi:hypothetical protein